MTVVATSKTYAAIQETACMGTKTDIAFLVVVDGVKPGLFAAGMK
jgi:hypothetical protein